MNRTMIAVTLLAAVVALAGCKKKDEEMGPAQKAGAAIDNAGDRVAKDIHDKLDKAHAAADGVADAAKAQGEAIKDATADATADAAKGLGKATEEVGKKVEQAGEKIQDAAKK
jgi:hypothetical protein